MKSCGPRAVRTLLTLLALAAGLILAALPQPTPAHAEEPVALVEVTLKSINPALPTRDGQITLTGTATNITSERIFRAQAYVWRNQAPITDREGFDQALISESNDPIGRREVIGYQNLYAETDPYLDPGETRDFTLTVPVTQLELSPTDGVYLMGVHVLQNNAPVAVGRARVFVPVVDTPPAEQLRMTSLVTFTSRPSLVRTGVLADDHLAREVAPNGRLSKLLAAADGDALSFAVDPALLDDLQTMAGGYSVLDGDGGTVPGAGAADATRWLGGFAALQGRRDGYRLLYGSPDLAALVHDGQQSAIRATAAASRRVTLTRNLPLLVLPTGGRADEATVMAATGLKPKAIVLSDRSAAGPGPLLIGPGAAPIVSAGSAVSAGGPGPDPRDTAVQLQQRLLAETWIEATSAANGTVRGRVRLITTANQATPAYAGVDAPWLTSSPLSTLLQARPAAWSEEYAYPTAVRDGELTDSQLSSLRRFNATQRTFTDLLVDGTQAEATGGAAVARAASGAWRQQDRARQAFLGPQQAAVDALVTKGVEIRSLPKVSTIDQEGVVFPITVRNTLPRGADPDANAIRASAGLHLRQRPPADHQADRAAADPCRGQRHRRRRGDRASQRHRAGDRPAAHRVRAPRRRTDPAGGAGHPERDHRLADRPRSRGGADRQHRAADPDRGEGARPAGRGRRDGRHRAAANGPDLRPADGRADRSHRAGRGAEWSAAAAGLGTAGGPRRWLTRPPSPVGSPSTSRSPRLPAAPLRTMTRPTPNRRRHRHRARPPD